jgi:hypothetical protein
VEELVRFIRDIGFPAGVAIFVLWRVDTAIREMTHAIIELKIALIRRDFIEFRAEQNKRRDA